MLELQTIRLLSGIPMSLVDLREQDVAKRADRHLILWSPGFHGLEQFLHLFVILIPLHKAI